MKKLIQNRLLNLACGLIAASTRQFHAIHGNTDPIRWYHRAWVKVWHWIDLGAQHLYDWAYDGSEAEMRDVLDGWATDAPLYQLTPRQREIRLRWSEFGGAEEMV